MDFRPTHSKLATFQAWLKDNGVKLMGNEIAYASEVKRGLGLYSPAGFQAPPHGAEAVAMVVPPHLIITSTSIQQDPIIGEAYRQLLEGGFLDERMLLMLFLFIERSKGPSSFWAPYISIIPQAVDTPLCYSEEELSHLRGTTLYGATLAKKRQLRTVFEEQFEPVAQALLSQMGSAIQQLNFHNFIWAYNTFWSRGLSIFVKSQGGEASGMSDLRSPCEAGGNESCSNPGELLDTVSQLSLEDFPDPSQVPHAAISPNPHGQAAPPAGTATIAPKSHTSAPGSNVEAGEVEDVAAAADAVAQADESPATGRGVTCVEGLVPGLDFCNHSPRPLARWELDEGGSITGIPGCIYLAMLPGTSGAPGQEICISYGGKGNEELLFLYGFALEDNPHDFLMVHVAPTDVLDRDPLGEVKLRLIEAQGLSLRWLLPLALLQPPAATSALDLAQPISSAVALAASLPPLHVEGGAEPDPVFHLADPQPPKSAPPEAEGCDLTAEAPEAGNEGSADESPGAGGGADGTGERAYEDMMAAMRVLSMSGQELEIVEMLLREGHSEDSEWVPSADEIQLAVWATCGNAGALRMIVQLLESRLEHMGTASGSEAMDAALLCTHREAELLLSSAQPRSGAVQPSKPRSLLSPTMHNIVVYRHSQKVIIRMILEKINHTLHA